MGYALRDYQEEGVSRIEETLASVRRAIYQLPTGGGKTVTGCEVIRREVERGGRVLFMAHRKELIDQCSRKLDDGGLWQHGIIQGSHPRQDIRWPIQVASVDTLRNRLDRLPMGKFTLVIIDECHRTEASTYQLILETVENAKILGLTATPIRTDGKPLANSYDKLICGPSVASLIEQGFLVPPVVWEAAHPDLSDVSKIAGEFSPQQLARKLDLKTVRGDLIREWRERADGRTTIVFSTTCKHGRHIAEDYNKAGIPAAFLDANSKADYRMSVLGPGGLLDTGEVLVLVNVGLATEGYDLPRCACIQWARLTASTTLHFQGCGRGLRPYTSKSDCIILDHVGNRLLHGDIDDPVEWDLEKGIIRKPKTTVSVKKGALYVCPACNASLSSWPEDCPKCNMPLDECPYCHREIKGRWPMECPTCGLMLPKRRRAMPKHDKSATLQRANRVSSQRWYYKRLLNECRNNGYKPGWIWHRYQHRYGEDPSNEVMRGMPAIRRVFDVSRGEETTVWDDDPRLSRTAV